MNNQNNANAILPNDEEVQWKNIFESPEQVVSMELQEEWTQRSVKIYPRLILKKDSVTGSSERQALKT